MTEELQKLQTENNMLRAIIAKSGMDCLYCGLTAEDMAKCQHGFPGCARADDAINDPRLSEPIILDETNSENLNESSFDEL